MKNEKGMECTTRRAAGTADILTAQFGWRGGGDDDIEQMEFDFYFTRNASNQNLFTIIVKMPSEMEVAPPS